MECEDAISLEQNNRKVNNFVILAESVRSWS